MADERLLLDNIYKAVTDCDDVACAQAAEEAIKNQVAASKIIETAVKAIDQVGEDFGNHKIFIPELMLAGMGLEKVMGLAQKQLLESGEVQIDRAVILLGSVAGDVHTIGKDLVITMWRAKGFQVHDLGVDVSRARFVSAAQELNADIVGLSSLMTTTLGEMREVIELFKVKGLRDRYKIIVGGGVCTQQWADEIGADGYAEDAARAVKLVESLIG